MSAYVYRGKKFGYDNIAAGSAAGQERHIAGGGGIETSRRSLDGANTSSGELPQVQTTDAVWLGGGGDPTSGTGEIRGSTSNTSLWTSTTSFTSKFPDSPGIGASTSQF